MKLTPAQIDYFNKEVDLNNAICSSEPTKNVITIIARREALRIIGELIRIKD
jgi:hypothetical protein